jgi:hypothetical protein
MLKTSKLSILIGVLAITATACTKDGEDTGNPYCSPVADAGADQPDGLLEGIVTLDATLSTWGAEGDECKGADDGLELTYAWTFKTVPVDSSVDESSLSDNNSPAASTPAFQPDMIGDYVLELTVCDEVACSDQPDLVIVTVNTGNVPPTADAGDDQVAELGERIQLDGSASSDPEGAELEFSWSLSSVPACSGLESDDLYNQGTATPSVICDCAGTFLVELVVTDGIQWSAPDDVLVECLDGNSAPVADAGDSGNMKPCTDSVIELNGFGSYDRDGDSLTYLWSVVSVPAESAVTDADISDAGLPNPEFSWDVAGDYTLQLEVFDGEEWSAPDIITMTFLDPTIDNNPPVANAGADDSVDLEADCETSSYVWTCAECEAQTFELDGSGSFDPDDDAITYSWESSDIEVDIESPYSYLTQVNIPETEATYGSTTSYDYDITLAVADCSLEDTDSVRLTVNCEGIH